MSKAGIVLSAVNDIRVTIFPACSSRLLRAKGDERGERAEPHHSGQLPLFGRVLQFLLPCVLSNADDFTVDIVPVREDLQPYPGIYRAHYRQFGEQVPCPIQRQDIYEDGID